jgi:hypothetical protein
MKDLRRILLVCVAVALLNVSSAWAFHMCPFCPSASSTLTRDAADAQLIVAGTLTNAKFDPNATFQGTTELVIENIVKDHAYLNNKKSIVLERYLPLEKDKPTKYLIFGDVFNGKLDAYRGVPLSKDSKIDVYLKGALEIKDKDASTRLSYFFKFLDATEVDVSQDAFMEFAASDYKDYRHLAEKLSPESIAKWLQDEGTPVSRFGLYGSMLGHCGKTEHADVLRRILEDKDKRLLSGVDGILAGYIMLRPKEGWEYLRRTLSEKEKDFMQRYAALRTARFFWEFRPDVISQKEVITAATLLIEQDDIADLAIEDLRKWEAWHLTDQILGLFDRKSHDVPIIRRAIMRFALSSAKNNSKSAEFVTAMRKKEADWVKDIEELLLLESTPKPAPAPKSKSPEKPLTK